MNSGIHVQKFSIFVPITKPWKFYTMFILIYQFANVQSDMEVFVCALIIMHLQIIIACKHIFLNNLHWRIQGGPWDANLSRSNFFQFHAVSGKYCQNKKLVPPWDWHPRSGKSWIRHWFASRNFDYKVWKVSTYSYITVIMNFHLESDFLVSFHQSLHIHRGFWRLGTDVVDDHGPTHFRTIHRVRCVLQWYLNFPLFSLLNIVK